MKIHHAARILLWDLHWPFVPVTVKKLPAPPLPFLLYLAGSSVFGGAQLWFSGVLVIIKMMKPDKTDNLGFLSLVSWLGQLGTW